MHLLAKKFLLFVSFVALAMPPIASHAATADLSIDQGSITFSTSTFYTGDVIRIYARIRNIGDVDMTAMVVFSQGASVIGATQPVSLRAAGAPEEVFVDFTVPSGSFNIRAYVSGADPVDENALNNEATTVLFTPLVDDDRDGVEDEVDNCANEENANQADEDSDGKGDACDTDDDNDTLSDDAEAVQNTDPLKNDTDGDGVNDALDAAPTNPAVTETPAPQPAATTSSQSATTASVASAAAEVPSDAASVTEEDSASTEETGIARPSSAFGIFSTSNPPQATGQSEGASWFRLSNPWIQASIVVLAVIIFSLTVLVLRLRRRHRDSDV